MRLAQPTQGLIGALPHADCSSRGSISAATPLRLALAARESGVGTGLSSITSVQALATAS
jgi:hypothetical protein